MVSQALCRMPALRVTAAGKSAPNRKNPQAGPEKKENKESRKDGANTEG